MRKKARVTEKLEKLAVADARHAVDFAEVVVLLLDATQGLEHQDLKIASHVLEEGRALMIAINKWDIAEDPSGLFNGIREALGDGLSQVKGVPLFSVSARTGKGLDTMLAAAFDLREAWSRRVPTAALKPLVRRCDQRQSSPRARRASGSNALRHPDQDPPAELRDLRLAAGAAAGELCALPGQRTAAGSRFRFGAGAADAAQFEEPLREED